jgi:hypothetical protein
MMTPIAQEHTGFATVFLSDINKPINKIGTVLIVHNTV